MVTLYANQSDIVIKAFEETEPLTVENFFNFCRSWLHQNVPKDDIIITHMIIAE